MPDILKAIVARKAERLAEAKRRKPLAEVRAEATARDRIASISSPR